MNSGHVVALVFGDTAQFWFNSKSVMLSEVACVVNYWSSSSSSDDCWVAFSSFSCDTEGEREKNKGGGGQVSATPTRKMPFKWHQRSSGGRL